VNKAKSVWIKADAGSWEENKPRVTTGLESGANAVLLNDEDISKVRELGNIKIAAHPRMRISLLSAGKRRRRDDQATIGFCKFRRYRASPAFDKEGKTVAGYVVIKNKKYEQFAVELGKSCDYLIVIGTDWKVIPLENLIAGLQKLDVEIIAGVQNSEEAKLALETLEHGSDGVLLDTDNLSEIKKVTAVRDRSEWKKYPS